eukprot:gene15387-20750_t
MNERCREFVDFLHGANTCLHAANTSIELPQIAVMGDTSSGKSSLLSAISGIELPSNDKLTTRCPLRLRMEKKTQEYAQIRILWVSNNMQRSQDDEWSKPKEVSNFKDIPELINQAQTHIMSKSNKQIAWDIIELSVYGPTCCDVTLIDLPGIVRSVAKDEDENIVTEIRDLIDSYLVNKRCVILAIVPANVDFHNSQIMADARRVDPSTDRTLPVITKPDLIDEGAEQGVKELLLGYRIDCSLGFHMVKCRGQKDLNKKVSIEDGLDKELEFFRSKSPWNDKDLIGRGLFGVSSLRDKLAEIQIEIIKSSLPEMIQDILSKKQENELILSNLSIIPTNESGRRLLALNSINNFLKELGNITRDGNFSDSNLDDKWDNYNFSGKVIEHFSKFRDDLLKSKLSNFLSIKIGDDVVVILDDGSETKGTYRGESIYSSEFLCIESESGAIKTKTLAKILVEDADLETMHYDSGSHGWHKFVKIPSTTEKGKTVLYKESYSGIPANNVRKDNKELIDLMRKKQSFDLPCFLNATLFAKICSDYIKKDWIPLCQNLIEHPLKIFHDLLAHILESILPKEFKYFKDAVSKRVEKVYQEVSKSLDNKMKDLTKVQDKPYTQNHYLFEIINKQRNKVLLQRVQCSLKASFPDGTGSIDSIVANVQAIFQANEAKSCDEHIAEEMSLILDAYGKVASKRIIDDLPMIIIDEISSFPQKLQEELTFSDVELQRYMEEPKKISVMRQKATQILAEMNLALEVVDKLKIF